MKNTNNIRDELIKRYKNKNFCLDKTGVRTIELIGETFIADEDFIIRKPNLEYIERELEWYKSCNLNINKIPGDTPEIWKSISSIFGEINSNYGWCIWHKDNYNQYKHVLDELISNKDSRRATMIYTRPKMWEDYNKDRMSDFMCTWGAQCFIRENKLDYLIIQRSVDAVFGYNNDLAWHKYVQGVLYNDLLKNYPQLKQGNIIYQTGSLHVYERHFKFIEEIIKNEKKS